MGEAVGAEDDDQEMGIVTLDRAYSLESRHSRKVDIYGTHVSSRNRDMEH